MQEILQVVLLFAALLAGGAAVFFSLRLQKQYKQSFVLSYFYYVLFMSIFGVYSLLGSEALGDLLRILEAPVDTIRSASFYALLVGIPFLILAKYMLIRCCVEFLKRDVPPWFPVAYFFLTLTALVAFGLAVVRLTHFGRGNYDALMQLQHGMFLGIMGSVYPGLFLLALVSSRGKRNYENRFIGSFTLAYLGFAILSLALYVLQTRYVFLGRLFVFVFLSWHLVPLLLLHVHLATYQRKPLRTEAGFQERLRVFVERHEISNRESEVLELICKGLTNQEIADALFISLQTVKDHAHRIFTKTGVKSRIQLSNLIRME